ncbi:hypothetical protein GW17_00052737 [Ensete ventricosum]|nr:hypothetical protein GW17_00052737 [Ensete ventricosum]
MATANHLAGAAGCGQAPYKGRSTAANAPMQRDGRLRQGPLQRGDWLSPGPARKGAAPVTARPQRQPPEGAAANGLQTTARGQPARGGRLRVRCPQEGSLRAEAPPARAAASSGNACRGGARGGASRRGGRPLAEWLPTGKGSRRLRRGNSGDGGTVRVKEG